MDGDLSSPEVVVFGSDANGNDEWTKVGIAHLRTGAVQWFGGGEGINYVGAAYAKGSSVPAWPCFYDIDGDGLPEALVPASESGYQGWLTQKTVVIGWVGGSAAVDQVDANPGPSALRAAQPNPTTGPASIAFSLPGRSRVQLSIFDVSGRRIADLLDGTLAGGTYSIPWDGRDDGGQPVALGTYFYQLTVDGREESKRMVVIR